MRVNEIFYSLQGEGHFTGTPAVFIRLSGCNLHCPFCDTEHQPYTEMSEQDIVDAVLQYPARHVVITGGEPGLQLTRSLIALLHDAHKFVQVETNGTKPLPADVDWVTCSPKGDRIVLHKIDELKVVYDGQDMSAYDGLSAGEYYLQPCDWKEDERNAHTLASCIEFIKNNPLWKLSLQTQKILNVQ